MYAVPCILETGDETEPIQFPHVIMSYHSPDHRWFIGTEFSPTNDDGILISIYRYDPLQLIVQIDQHMWGDNTTWSPDSQYLAVWGDRGMVVWQIFANNVFG